MLISLYENFLLIGVFNFSEYHLSSNYHLKFIMSFNGNSNNDGNKERNAFNDLGMNNANE